MSGIVGLVLQKGRPRDSLDGEKIIRGMINGSTHLTNECKRIKKISRPIGGKEFWVGCSSTQRNNNDFSSVEIYTSRNKRWEVIFHGKISNCTEIDNLLSAFNVEVSTKSNAERIAEIISNYGFEGLHSIDGMFTFAAFENLSESLLLARDRIGQKSLYYINYEDIFAFSSDFSALLSLSTIVPMSVNADTIGQYFSLGYIPSPGSAVHPIMKLEPGQYLLHDKKGDVLLDRFFSCNPNGTLCSNDHTISLDVIRSKPIQITNQFIKQSIIKCVPCEAAVMLNGQKDSTLIAYYIAEQDKRMGWDPKSRTGYSLHHEYQSETNAELTKSICIECGWRNHAISITEQEEVNTYLELADSLEEPNGDYSLIFNYILGKNIGLQNQNAIGSFGGDELFLQHERHKNILHQITNYENSESWAKIYWTNINPIGNSVALKEAIEQLKIEPLRDILHKFRILQDEWEHNPKRFLQLLDITTYVPERILSQVNRTGMECGVEIYSPLLHTQLLLAAMAILPSEKVDDLNSESILDKLLKIKFNKLPIAEQLSSMNSTKPFLNLFLKDRVINGVTKLRNLGLEEFSLFIEKIFSDQSSFSNDNLFAISIYIDWLNKLLSVYPSIRHPLLSNK